MSDKPESEQTDTPAVRAIRNALRLLRAMNNPVALELTNALADVHDLERDLNAANAKLQKAQENLKYFMRLASQHRNELEDKLERCRKLNESVSVCEKHTAQIIGGPCVICELERYRVALRKAWKDLKSGHNREDVTDEIEEALKDK